MLVAVYYFFLLFCLFCLLKTIRIHHNLSALFPIPTCFVCHLPLLPNQLLTAPPEPPSLIGLYPFTLNLQPSVQEYIHHFKDLSCVCSLHLCEPILQIYIQTSTKNVFKYTVFLYSIRLLVLCFVHLFRKEELFENFVLFVLLFYSAFKKKSVKYRPLMGYDFATSAETDNRGWSKVKFMPCQKFKIKICQINYSLARKVFITKCEVWKY